MSNYHICYVVAGSFSYIEKLMAPLNKHKHVNSATLTQLNNTKFIDININADSIQQSLNRSKKYITILGIHIINYMPLSSE